MSNGFLKAIEFTLPQADCILWTKGKDEKGYGLTKVKGKTKKIHRLVWEVTFGPIPEGLCVCHKCDVRNCINPDHLFLATHKENMADMKVKGRAWCGGNGGKTAKLTTEQVIDIYTSSEQGVSLAKKYGVSKSLVSQIKTGHRRKEITQDVK